MEVKNIIFILSVGCMIAAFGIGRWILQWHFGDMGTIFNPKEVILSQKEKAAAIVSVILLFLAIVLFVIAMVLQYN